MSDELEEIEAEVKKCRKCQLHMYRKNPVVGEGPANAEIMFVGEAPGRREDELGRPFVGAAGKLLDKILDSIGLDRESVYITNVVKCRPPNNRTPLESEVKACINYLIRQILAIKPKVIVALGAVAASYLCSKNFVRGEPIKLSITRVRGKVYKNTVGNVEFIVIPTYHPAAILRKRGLEEELRNDLLKASSMLRTGDSFKQGLLKWIR